MKRLFIPLGLAGALMAAILPTAVLAEVVNKDSIQVMNDIATNDNIRPHQAAFPEQIRENLVRSINHSLDQRQPVIVFGQNKTWQRLENIKSLTEPGIQLLRLELSTNQFTKGKLQVSGLQTASLYLDGELISGSKGEYSLSLYNGEHRILVVAEQVDNWKNVAVDWTSDDAKQTVVFHKNAPRHRLNAKQMFDAQTISNISLSPDGKQMVWSMRHYNDDSGNKAITETQLLDVKSLKVLYRWQAMTPGGLRWSPDNRYLSYTTDNTLFLLERQTLELNQIAEKLEGAYGFEWLNSQTMVFNWNREDDSAHAITKRYRALEDRWTGWRNNNQIYLLDTNSGFIKQLSDNKLSTNLIDIDKTNNKLLVSRDPIDYQAPPHGLIELLELDINSQSEKLIGSYRSLIGAAYGNHGIYFLASPNFANGLGNALGQDGAYNNYDTQLYFRDKNGEFEALSKQFDPAINSLQVMANNELLLSVVDQDRVQLYTFSPKSKQFKKLDTQLDVIGSYSVSNELKPSIVYRGTTAVEPQKAYLIKHGQKPRLLFDSEKTEYPNARFVSIRDWDFTNSKGEVIDGRFYLPTDFDASKKYPTIVYYYGGTSSVKRGFTGRWPFSLWASQGYVVYIMQPSGTTGYGQKFSAKHVNAWGKDTAQDIIDSTKAFVKSHPFVDEKRLGNMGASYGGFMTMYLATQTDMFAASISHAGISNLSEYWGYGWWGYLYSGVASQGSFPWNNSQLYVKQSPLYSADKITTPLLLLHGDSDTNVPVTESHMMYTALKLQDKDVELIEFAGDDHHINSRDHRFRWWNTITAYFDKKLKDQPQWWNDLYPEN